MKTSEINVRDPFVLVNEGKYYLYGTRGATCWGSADGFDVYVSTDMMNWSEPICCFHNDGSFWATENYWAPEVYRYQGKYILFASFKAPNVCRGTSSLIADSPLGPFRPLSQGSLTPKDWECLDGTLYIDGQGKPYMIFCHEWVQITDGTVCMIPLSDDLSKAAGEPRVLFAASQGAPLIKTVHHKRTGIDGYVTDGPFPYRMQDGRLLLLWSSFSKEGYTQSIAVSDNKDVTGRFTQLDPLFTKDGGHGMVFTAPNGQLYLTLHSPNEHLLERPQFIKIKEQNGTLVKA